MGDREKAFAEASVIAGYVSESKSRRKIEDGPYGGTMISIGDARVGEVLASSLSGNGDNWGSVRVSDYSLAQTAYALLQSKLWLPGNLSSLELPTTVLDTPGKLGFYHLDINGPPPRHGALPRGPFTNGPPSPTATYPCLWSHTATRETRIVCEPDSQLSVRSSMEEKAATVWATASRSHLNRDFTFGSQPLAVAFTERESMGGRVWPNVMFRSLSEDFDTATARIFGALKEQEETVPVDLSPLIDEGLLLVVRLETPSEEASFVELAAVLDDGEAVTGAIALNRGHLIAIDDRKARRVLGEKASGMRLVSTLDLMHQWCPSVSVQEVSHALRAMQLRARYVPGQQDPLYAWWRDMMEGSNANQP